MANVFGALWTRDQSWCEEFSIGCMKDLGAVLEGNARLMELLPLETPKIPTLKHWEFTSLLSAID